MAAKTYEFLVRDDATRQAFREIWQQVDLMTASTTFVSTNNSFGLVVNASYNTTTGVWTQIDTSRPSWAAEANATSDFIRILRAPAGSVVITWVEKARFDATSLRLTAHLLWATDNAYDIGASGATRPRNQYLAGFLRLGADVDLQRGAANRLDVLDAMRLSGLLDFATDNLYDIGAAGANRPRNEYLAGFLRFGADVDLQRGAADRLDVLDALRLSGMLDFASDNASDIGASGANRPRTGYFGTSLVVPTIGPAAAQQHTLPAVTSDTVALLAASQVFSNKAGVPFEWIGMVPTLNVAVGTEFAPLSGVSLLTDATEANRQEIVDGGEALRLRVYLQVAPATTAARTFTLRVNGADTALTVTYASGDSGLRTSTATVTLAAGDRVALSSVVVTAVAAASQVAWSLRARETAV